MLCPRQQPDIKYLSFADKMLGIISMWISEPRVETASSWHLLSKGSRLWGLGKSKWVKFPVPPPVLRPKVVFSGWPGWKANWPLSTLLRRRTTTWPIKVTVFAYDKKLVFVVCSIQHVLKQVLFPCRLIQWTWHCKMRPVPWTTLVKLPTTRCPTKFGIGIPKLDYKAQVTGSKWS